jgi:hypothetical protein
MPDGREPEEWETRPTSKLSPSWWLAHIFPSKSRRSDKPRIGDRLREAVLKPPTPGEVAISDEPETVEELRLAVKFASDKERLIGLLAAPFAAAIGFTIGRVLVSHDPPAELQNGSVNRLHVAVSLYNEATLALVVLGVVMLICAYFRKRLYLAIVMALYGLTVFNLHYWGFGVPYILAGAWMLVRSYRLQKSLRVATGDTSRYGPNRSGGSTPSSTRPRPNRRYTPPTSR